MTTCTRCKIPVEDFELVRIAGKPVCLGCTSDDELASLLDERMGPGTHHALFHDLDDEDDR